MQLFNAVDSIQPVYKAVPAYDTGSLCDVNPRRWTGNRAKLYAWMRTFLLNAFEIVVIALTMVISFKLIGAGISLFDGKNIVTSMVDGFWDALNSLFTMILVNGGCKRFQMLSYQKHLVYKCAEIRYRKEKL